MESMYVVRPSLGQPQLVSLANKAVPEIRATVLCSAEQPRPGLAFRDKLFLQRLDDTRRVLQDASVLKPISFWSASDKQTLIPLGFAGVLRSYEVVPNPAITPEHKWAVDVRLIPESRHINTLNLPILLNIVCDWPSPSPYQMLPFQPLMHSVYLYSESQDHFRVAHAPDTHIAWRWDVLETCLEDTDEGRGGYENPNENLRRIVEWANQKSKDHQCDLIVLNGDIVENIEDDRSLEALQKQKVIGPPNNYLVLEGILCGWKRWDLEVVREEVRVPVLTSVGNHDFRRPESPLIFDAKWGPFGKRFEDYYKLNINQQGALRYQYFLTGKAEIPELGTDDAMALLEPQTHCTFGEGPFPTDTPKGFAYAPDLPEYQTVLNVDFNYFTMLGKMTLVVLNTGPDIGLLDLWDVVKLKGGLGVSESQHNMVAESPDSWGLQHEGLEVLNGALGAAKGSSPVAVFMHAPPVNIMGNTPNPLLRESERPSKQDVFWPDPEDPPTGIPDFGTILALVEKEAYVSYVRSLYKYTNCGETHPHYLYRHWGSCIGEPFFKQRRSDASIQFGVAESGIPQLIELITEPRRPVDIVLCGHTHRAIEYRVTHDATVEMPWIYGDPKGVGPIPDERGMPQVLEAGYRGLTRFFHDYYIDGTIHGDQPSDYWKPVPAKDYPDPLGNCPGDKRAWWTSRRPLIVQTVGAGTKQPDQKGKKPGLTVIAVEGDVIVGIERFPVRP